jgi:hypothetical protein
MLGVKTFPQDRKLTRRHGLRNVRLRDRGFLVDCAVVWTQPHEVVNQVIMTVDQDIVVHQLAAFRNELLVHVGLDIVFGLQNCIFSGHATRYKVPAFLVVGIPS